MACSIASLLRGAEEEHDRDRREPIFKEDLDEPRFNAEDYPFMVRKLPNHGRSEATVHFS